MPSTHEHFVVEVKPGWFIKHDWFTLRPSQVGLVKSAEEAYRFADLVVAVAAAHELGGAVLSVSVAVTINAVGPVS